MKLNRLQNGLTVAIKRVPNKVVTLDAWVNVGSANETPDLNGVSHFLEHMMFKGTPTYGVGDLDKTIMNVGGVWNAGTSKDFTHYYVTVAAPFFQKALDAISDMMQHALIDADEFAREKNVILEEYRRKQDSPWGMLFDELYMATFAEGPYRNSVLGSFESISNLQRDDMAAYYRAHYQPNNMLFCVIGDVDPDEALKAVDTAFNSPPPLDPARLHPAHQPSPTVYGSPTSRTIQRDVFETYVAMAFPAPGIHQPADVLALDIASIILGSGRSSRMNRILHEEQRVANSVSAGSPTHRSESMFYVAMTTEAADTEKATTLAGEILNGMASTAPPTEAEMAKARRNLRNDIQFGTETNTGQSSMIGYYYTLTGSTDFLDQYIERVDSITADQVADVVQRHLTVAPVTLILQPGSTSNATPTPQTLEN
ncbi:hypothetical protein CVU37_00950 [candidate division BRC1 bacterium HGW-BRC1-1]|jgi:predicted Zn-dependent peptidase|nr:MAG: hypothetical protein CVU37_00950 [candidate division BRC1 bacterium HGW-BRC1-1]